MRARQVGAVEEGVSARFASGTRTGTAQTLGGGTLELLDDVEDGALAASSRWAEAELRRIRGELLLAGASADGDAAADAAADIRAEARLCFDDAVAVARAQGAGFLLDRAIRSTSARPEARPLVSAEPPPRPGVGSGWCGGRVSRAHGGRRAGPRGRSATR